MHLKALGGRSRSRPCPIPSGRLPGEQPLRRLIAQISHASLDQIEPHVGVEGSSATCSLAFGPVLTKMDLLLTREVGR